MPYDAILIPGGGVRAGAVLPPWVEARFDRALALAGNALFMPLSAGTPYRPPPLDEHGFPITEARAGAEYLVRRGVDPRRIAIEEASYDTIGNAYFSRVLHAIPRGLERVLVVTSAFHAARAEAVFRWVYGLDGPGPVCTAEFETVPDTGIDAESLGARAAKERDSLAALGHLISRIPDLAALHAWLFTDHAAYAAGPRARSAATIDVSTY